MAKETIEQAIKRIRDELSNCSNEERRSQIARLHSELRTAGYSPSTAEESQMNEYAAGRGLVDDIVAIVMTALPRRPS